MLEMCLRTLELFSVFIGFIFMFLYLYKHTHLITHPENGATEHYNMSRAHLQLYDTQYTDIARKDSGVGRAVPRKAGLYRVGVVLVRTQRCAVLIAAGQPFNPVQPGSCQCGSVLSTDWSTARRAQIRTNRVNKSHFPGTSGPIFTAIPR